MTESETTGTVFACRLREERRAKDIAQTALAERISQRLGTVVDGSAITRIEKQARSVKLDEAVAIAEALGIPLSSLLVHRSDVDKEIIRVREDLVVTEHARAAAAEKAAEFADRAAALRRSLQELEASRES